MAAFNFPRALGLAYFCCWILHFCWHLCFNSLLWGFFLSFSRDSPLFDFIESCLRNKHEMVVYEAASAIVNLPNCTAKELAPAVSGKPDAGSDGEGVTGLRW